MEWGNRIAQFILCFLVIGIFASAVPAEEDYTGTITVVVGQTRIIPYNGVRKVSIGHEDIANASQTAPDEILITGLKVGQTDFRVWRDGQAEVRYLLKVIDTSWEQALKVAKIILEDVEGVSARAENGIVFVEGRLLRSYDMGIIAEMKNRFSGEITKGKMIFNVAAPSVSLKAMVMLDVKVVEVRRSETKRLGIDWAEEIAGPTFAYTGVIHGLGNVDTGVSLLSFGSEEGLGIIDGDIEPISQLSSVIRLLEEEGSARILAEPKLITKSGSAAEFLGGGEIPIPVVDSQGETKVSFKQVGVILNIQPVADPDGYIATKLEIEVSSIDSSVSVLGIPGFLVRRTISDMNMLSGQTMVVSGMLSAEDSKAVSKFPGLSAVPIIGELFKSRNFRNSVTEIMVFVTPHLVDPEGKKNQMFVDYGQKLQDEDLEFSIFD